MPCYNEQENIENVVRNWIPLLDGKSDSSRLLVADSGSTDSTNSILKKLQSEFCQLEILSDTQKQHGPKVIALYKKAIENNADYIFQTDSDGQTNPAQFNSFWEMRNQYDAIIGHRKIRGDGKSRAFVEKVVCFLLKIYFGVKVPDANAPFRLMKSSLVAKYISRFDSNYNLPNIMLTTWFSFYKENITFKTITFNPRQGGKNSINIRKIFKIGVKALFDFKEFKKEMKKGIQK